MRPISVASGCLSDCLTGWGTCAHPWLQLLLFLLMSAVGYTIASAEQELELELERRTMPALSVARLELQYVCRLPDFSRFLSTAAAVAVRAP